MKRRVTLQLAILLRIVDARAAEPGEVTDEVRVRGTAASGFSSKANLDAAPREVTDAASLVEPLPGVHVRRLGADDGFATLSIRGTSSTEVAVYLAGVPLTGGADPTLDLATLPLWPGARARVYRSFAPASVGPGSLGGVLVLDPPGAQTSERTEVWVGAGSFGALRMRAGDVRALENGGRVVSAISASRATDDFSYFDPFAVPGGETRTRENAGHAAVNGLVGWYVPMRVGDAQGHLAVTALAQARRQELPGTIERPTPEQRLDSDRELASIELSVPSARGAWIGRLWGRRDGLRVSDTVTDTGGFGPTHTDDTIAALGGSAGWRGRPSQEVTLDVRVDGSGERYVPGAWIDFTPPPGATRASAGVATDVEWRATESFTADASGRLDVWSDHGGVDAKDDVRPTGHLGGELKIGPAAIASHIGALARPPSFIERFGNRGAFIGDPALRPESAYTVDLGARAGAPHVSGELVGFATWADDLIVFVPSGAYGQQKATNIGRARIAGVEALAEARAGGAELRVAYTFVATENDSECALGTGACERPPLVGRPAHDLVADAAYRVGPARVRYGVDVVSGIDTATNGDPTHVVPTRVLQSAGARVDLPFMPGVRISIDVRNLFDVRTGTYEGLGGRYPIGDLYEYPLPGRSLLVTARYLH